MEAFLHVSLLLLRRAQHLDAREAAVAARERAAGGGLDSDLMAATLEALPNGHGSTAKGRAVCLHHTFPSWKLQCVPVCTCCLDVCMLTNVFRPIACKFGCSPRGSIGHARTRCAVQCSLNNLSGCLFWSSQGAGPVLSTNLAL